MNNSIFREYDIRGIVDTDFADDVVINLGRAYGSFLRNNNQNNISVSGDIRYSTNNLKKNLVEGLLSTGINVFDMGVLPTPVNYFSLFHTDIPNSVQITGSHNPKEYNGFKLSFNKKPFFGKDILLLKETMINKLFFKSLEKGNYKKIDILEDYTKMIKNNITINKEINCVIDCGNSVGGLVVPNLYKELGINVKELYCDINPDFPNHHPDPTVDSNLDKIRTEINGKYDLGLAFDGDVDRVVAIDDKSNIIRADILMGIFVKDLIKKNDTVVYDVKCSRSLEEVIKKQLAKPIMYKTGHSLIKNKMIETKSKFGGEMSGHIFFADKYYGYDDGIYVGLRLIELLADSSRKLSEYLEDMTIYPSTPEIRIDCKDDKHKFEIVKELISYFSNKYECNLIDGVRIEFDYGWGLIRASNTQPVIVCRFEANTEEKLFEIKSLIFNQINAIGGFSIEF